MQSKSTDWFLYDSNFVVWWVKHIQNPSSMFPIFWQSWVFQYFQESCFLEQLWMAVSNERKLNYTAPFILNQTEISCETSFSFCNDYLLKIVNLIWTKDYNIYFMSLISQYIALKDSIFKLLGQSWACLGRSCHS